MCRTWNSLHWFIAFDIDESGLHVINCILIFWCDQKPAIIIFLSTANYITFELIVNAIFSSTELWEFSMWTNIQIHSGTKWLDIPKHFRKWSIICWILIIWTKKKREKHSLWLVIIYFWTLSFHQKCLIVYFKNWVHRSVIELSLESEWKI